MSSNDPFAKLDAELDDHTPEKREALLSALDGAMNAPDERPWMPYKDDTHPREIRGYITSVGRFDLDKNPKRDDAFILTVLVPESDDSPETHWVIKAYHYVLESQLAKFDLAPGKIIGIAYRGKAKSANGDEYYNYRVAVV
jgi:hypothetical protein